MKHLLLLNLLLSVSCTAIKGNRTLGTFSYNSLGGDVSGMSLGPEGIAVTTINNSTAFKDATALVKAMFKAYLTAAGLNYSVGKYYDNQNKIVSADKTVKLEELRNAKSVSEGNQALEALRITSEVPTP